MSNVTLRTSSERANEMFQSVLNGVKKQHIIINDAPEYGQIIDLNLNSYRTWLDTKNARIVLEAKGDKNI